MPLFLLSYVVLDVYSVVRFVNVVLLSRRVHFTYLQFNPVRAKVRAMKDTLANLERLVQIHGAAKVSVWLGYRDTRAIRQWSQRKAIPPARVDLVESILKKRS